MLHLGEKFKFRIALTERCQASCPHCFNADTRHGRVMDASKLFGFLDYNAKIPSQEPENYAKRVYIMGGEPTLHPDFVKVTKKLGHYFKAKSIFSNGVDLGSWLGKVKFGPLDSLILNGYTANLDDPYLGRTPRNTCFHFVVSAHTIGALPARVKRVLDGRLGGVNLSIDTTRDLRKPEERDLFRSWREIFLRFANKGYPFGIDHCVPYCLRDRALKEALIKLGRGTDLSGCGRPKLVYHTSCMGLIKANFDLMYCNQTPMRVCNLFDRGRTMTFQEVYDNLVIARNRKFECLSLHDPVCGKCGHLKDCLGACITHGAVSADHWKEGEARW